MSAPMMRRCLAASKTIPNSQKQNAFKRPLYQALAGRHYVAEATKQEQAKKCAFCGHVQPLSGHLCASCNAPSPIPESVSFYSYFSTMKPPPPEGPFSIDTRALRMQFLKAQQKVHPDNFSSDEKKRLIAESTSSLLNKAYSTLLQPLSRAEYLLSLQGIEAASEGDKLTDPELLMTVMEAREEIDEASSQEDLENVRKSTEARIASEIASLETHFAQDDLIEAKRSAVKLRYWLNIQKALKDWEPGQEIVLDH